MNKTRSSRPIHRLAALPLLATALGLPALAQQPAAGARPAATTQATPQTTPAANSVAATPAPAAQAGPYRALRASKLIGMEVQNREGRHIGQIDDLVVNMGNGDLRYAVLSFDPGVMGGERLFALPPDRLAFTPEGDRVVVDVDKQQFEKAAIERTRYSPAFFRDHAQVAVLDRAWSIPQPGRGTTAHRVTDLLEADVLARNGDEMGDVEELVLDLGSRKVHYAVVSFDPGWTSAEKRYLFALSDFRLPRDPEDVQLDLDRDGMRRLQGFDGDRMKDLNAAGWVADVRRSLAQGTGARAGAAPTDAAAR
ncbi:PRC-barrel domain-containing protein [Aquincola tertiaricarbonis]|uniref:PRC-barrel domain-containing protein n=1 Tax=Aquincola tertiaricarbonis TaxID=391953 RepID=UPI00069684CF|nr:PRC-barrel domain-containing protein [Aquincola tertiaricarbonis]